MYRFTYINHERYSLSNKPNVSHNNPPLLYDHRILFYWSLLPIHLPYPSPALISVKSDLMEPYGASECICVNEWSAPGLTTITWWSWTNDVGSPWKILLQYTLRGWRWLISLADYLARFYLHQLNQVSMYCLPRGHSLYDIPVLSTVSHFFF